MNILKLGKGSNFARKHKQTSSVRSVLCKLLLLQKMQIHYLLSWNHDINHGSYLAGFVKLQELIDSGELHFIEYVGM